MATIKWCSIAYQHATHISNNVLGDPTVGNSYDGHLLSALTGGFHTNFDSASMTYGLINTTTAGGAGEIAIPGMTANGRVAVSINSSLGNDLVFDYALPGVDKVTLYVKNASSATPIAPAAIADGVSAVIKVLALDATTSANAERLTIVPIKGMVATNGSRINGLNSDLYVHAAINGTSTLYASTAGLSASKFHFDMADTDAKASNLGFSQKDNFLLPAATGFAMAFDVADWTNRSLLASHGLVQVGMIAGAHANFATDITAGPQLASASGIYVQFAANTMKLVFGTTSSAIVNIPTTLTTFSVRIEYRAGRGAYLYLNNRMVAQVTSATATTAMQVFARAGHTASYAAATDAPINFGLDAISVAYDK